MSVLTSENKRYISSCEFKITSRKDKNFVFNIDDIAQNLINNYPNNVYYRNNKKSAYRVLKAKVIANKYLVIFMQYANKAASDPAFANTINGKSRIIKKNNDEGVACSGHLVINIKDNDPLMKNQFKASFEDIQGLSRNMVCCLINHILSKLKVQDPQDPQKTHTPYVELTYYASNTFEEQLENGKIESIVAYKENISHSCILDNDDNDNIQYKEIHKLEFKTPLKQQLSNPFDLIKKVVGISKELGFNKIKITHESEKKQQSANYSMDAQEPSIDEVIKDMRLAPFISKEPITLANSLSMCECKWSSELIREMIKRL